MEDRIHLLIGVGLCAAFGVVFLLLFLGAMYQREAVKQDLFGRGCTPLRIWWVPFSLYASFWGISFHVLYRDAAGFRHTARCYVDTALMDSAFGERRVKWTKDEVKAMVD
jgi:hypothetical protein